MDCLTMSEKAVVGIAVVVVMGYVGYIGYQAAEIFYLWRKDKRKGAGNED